MIQSKRLPGFNQPFWACFPLALAKCSDPDIGTALTAIDQSESDILVVNAPPTRPITADMPCNSCLREFRISQDALDQFLKDRRLQILNNINRSRTVADALVQVANGMQSTGAEYIKAEILSKTKIPDNKLVLEMCRECRVKFPKAKLIPFLYPNTEDMKEAEDLGCVAVRLLAGRIGEKSGLQFGPHLRAAIESATVPIILEGGIASVEDIGDCFSLGANYVLCTSALLDSPVPGHTARVFQEEARRAVSRSRTLGTRDPVHF